MYPPLSAAQLQQLRRNAKRLSRALAIPHSEALDRVAAERGFKNWSLLCKHSAPAAQPQAVSPSLPLSASKSTVEGLPPDSRQRYYLHGDQLEDDAARYYCGECDLFLEAEHLLSHGLHTGERYLESHFRWSRRDERSKRGWRRPDDAANILRDPALAARAQYQALRTAFSDWLLEQGRRLRTGERCDNVALRAVSLLSSRGLPTRPQSLAQLLVHYRGRGKQHLALEALEAAWAEFLAERSAAAAVCTDEPAGP